MPDSLTIEGKHYALLGTQKSGASVYRGISSFLRIGPAHAIQRDLAFHRRMEQAKFPVAPILSEGTYGAEAYFIEQSFGERSFSAMFNEEYAHNGAIADVNFDNYIVCIGSFFKSQMTTRTTFKESDLRFAIRLDQLADEFPHLRNVLDVTFKKTMEQLQIFPGALTHGDLTAANAYPTGVIDLEDSFVGPIGFDIVSALISKEWTPEGDYEPSPFFRFTGDQQRRYFEYFDALCLENNIPKISEAVQAFSFCRGVWLCAGMAEWPKTQKWRVEKLVHEHLA